MKRIVCLILALVCVFALASCEDKALVAFAEVVEGTAEDAVVYTPSEIKTLTTIDTEDETFNGTYVTLIDGEGVEFQYSYERYAELADATEDYITTVEGVVYYKDGKYSEDGIVWTVETPDVDMMGVTLCLDGKNFTTYQLSKDGKTLVATFSAEAAEAVLGRALSASGEITMTVKTNGTYLTRVTISYETENSTVLIDTSYTYSAPVSDAE